MKCVGTSAKQVSPCYKQPFPCQALLFFPSIFKLIKKKIKKKLVKKPEKPESTKSSLLIT